MPGELLARECIFLQIIPSNLDLGGGSLVDKHGELVVGDGPVVV